MGHNFLISLPNQKDLFAWGLESLFLTPSFFLLEQPNIFGLFQFLLLGSVLPIL